MVAGATEPYGPVVAVLVLVLWCCGADRCMLVLIGTARLIETSPNVVVSLANADETIVSSKFSWRSGSNGLIRVINFSLLRPMLNIGSRKRADVTSENNVIVPVWTLATEAVNVSNVFGDGEISGARLGELRSALSAFADVPIATLEAHPIANTRDRSSGIPLNATSPLAQQLARLITDTAKTAPAKVNADASGEALYRMVVPAKVAAEFGKGLVKSVPSKSVPGGVYGVMRNSTGFAANATFVPVTSKATTISGAAAGSAATAGVATAGAGVITVAAPLVLMAVAVGVSAHAEQQRQQAIERVTELLEKLHEEKLDEERNELGACRDAIEKATSILLDKGRIGQSLGLDSAAFAVSEAFGRAGKRLRNWQAALDPFPEGAADVSALAKAFPGITEDGGEFRAHLEIARLAISLKRRLIVLQAVEHAQGEKTENLFKSFVGTLREDESRVGELEAGINSVLYRLSTIEIRRGNGIRNIVATNRDVDSLLKSVYKLRALGQDLSSGSEQSDVSIEIERQSDGSVIVFPAEAV